MRAATPTIQLFGQFCISCRGRVAELGIAGVTRELLAYLLTTAGKATRRDSLTEMFWEDMEFNSARAALNTAVWRVNRVLRPLRGLTLVSTADGGPRSPLSSTRTTRSRGSTQTSTRSTPRSSGAPALRCSRSGSTSPDVTRLTR